MKIVSKTHQRAGGSRLSATGGIFWLVPAFLLAAILTGCSGGNSGETTQQTSTQQASASTASETTAKNGTTKAKTSSFTITNAGGATQTSSSVEEQNSSGGQKRAQKATLRIEGTPGTKFSGACAAAGKSEDLNGQVPARYVYNLDGQGLACRIYKQSNGGVLKLTLDAGNDHTSQQITSGTIRLAYNNGRISVSQTSFSP